MEGGSAYALAQKAAPLFALALIHFDQACFQPMAQGARNRLGLHTFTDEEKQKPAPWGGGGFFVVQFGLLEVGYECVECRVTDRLFNEQRSGR